MRHKHKQGTGCVLCYRNTQGGFLAECEPAYRDGGGSGVCILTIEPKQILRLRGSGERQPSAEGDIQQGMDAANEPSSQFSGTPIDRPGYFHAAHSVQCWAVIAQLII